MADNKAAAFAAFISDTFDSEGRVMDYDPNDRGNWSSGEIGVGYNGGTNHGIATHAYADELQRLPVAERAAFPKLVKDLTVEQITRLYRAAYWDTCRCDELPPALARVVADYAINSGVNRAVTQLQSISGAVPDGALGPASMAAVAKLCATPDALASTIASYNSSRLHFLQSLSTFADYGHGWSNRVVRLSVSAARLI